MDEKNKRIKQEIIKTRKSILLKYRALNKSKFDQEETHREKYKLITDPLNHIVNAKYNLSVHDRPKQKYEDGDEKSATSKNNIDGEINDKEDIQSIEENTVDSTDDDDGENNIEDDGGPSISSVNNPYVKLQRIEPRKLFGDSEYDIMKYLDLIDSANGDKVFGVKKCAKPHNYKLGRCPFSLIPNQNKILVGNSSYNASRGLMDLIFLNKPPKTYDEHDLRMYKEVLDKTNAHKKNFAVDGEMKKPNTYKYTYVVKPLFHEGGAIETLFKIDENRNIDYKYWDDPNELVERLHLLISSSLAGHNNHQNEIISIIEELQEANIIE